MNANLKQIIKDGQQVLERRVLGNLAQHRVEGLGQLGRVLPDESLPSLGVARIEARYEVEVVLADHLRPVRHQIHQDERRRSESGSGRRNDRSEETNCLRCSKPKLA